MELTLSSSDLARMPEFLLELVGESPAKVSAASNVAQFRSRSAPADGISRYARAALDDEVETLRKIVAGARNDELNKAAFSLGQLVGGKQLPRSLVEEELYAAANSNGLVGDDGESSVRATIHSGVEAGVEEPRGPQLVSSASPASRGAGGGKGRERRQRLPEIHITPQVKEVTDQAIDALLHNASGEIFQKSRLLVRVMRDGRKVVGLKRPAHAPVIGPLPEGRLLELMASSARWQKFDKRTGDWEPTLPPKTFVQVLTDRAQWPFPHLEAVSEVPVLRPDGTILDEPGYDDATGILYVPNAAFADIPQRPTREDARRALLALYEPFMDFPFKTQADASVFIGGILTVLGRPAILGPTPMIVIRKNAPGVGGSLAVDGISIITTGRPAARLTMTNDAAELRKLILTIAIEGTPLVLFDNLEGAVGSPVLAAAITADTWSDRLLGYNKKATAPLRPTWFATGNGLTFKRDLGRRVALCDMVTDLEHPEDRDDFQHPDLLGYLADARPKLVGAGLTLLRSYCVAGRPAHGKSRKGSFVEWDEMVRGALIWAGADDPLQTTQRVRAEADTDLEALNGALTAWEATFDEAVTTAQVAERAKLDQELRAALAALIGCPSDKVDSQNVGYALRKYKERIANGRRFMKVDDDSHKAGLWTVRAV